ncbi:MAG: DUF456 domain-containing protein [Syntrophales bacterium]
MTPLEIAGLTAFILILFLGLFSTLFGLPGTLIILTAAVVYSFITGFQTIGFKIILCLIVISVLAETLEFLLNVTGAARFGASREGITVSIIGALIGAALMTPLLLGLGTLVGALLGAFTGILLVELIRQKSLKPAARASYGALLGRITGLFAKSFFALIMVIIVLAAIYS